MNRLLARLRARLRRWLGIDADRHDAEHAAIVLTLELAAARQRETELTEAVTTLATKNLHLSQIVQHQNKTLARWAQGSETLRAIEARHKREQSGAKILTIAGD